MAEDTKIVFGSFREDNEEYQKFLQLFEASQSRTSAGRVQFPWDPVQHTAQDESTNLEAVTQPSINIPGASKSEISSNPVEVMSTISLSEPDKEGNGGGTPVVQAQSDFRSETKRDESTQKSNIPPLSAISDNANFDQTLENHTRTESEISIDDGIRKRRNKKKRDPNYYKQYTQSSDYHKVKNSQIEKNKDQDTIIQIEQESSNSSQEGISVETASLISTASSASFEEKITVIQEPKNLSESPLDHRTSGQAEPVIIDQSNLSAASPNIDANFVSHSTPQNVSLSNNVPQNVTESLSDSSQTLTLQETSERTLNVNKDVSIEVSSTLLSEKLEQVPAKNIEVGEESNLSSKEESNPPAVNQEEKPKAAPPKPTSWASLFKGGSSGLAPASTVISYSVAAPVESAQEKVDDEEDQEPVSVDKDARVKSLGEFLKSVSVNNKAMFLQPRGLINVANNCYINSILQILIACPPFYNFIRGVPLPAKGRGPSSTPMLDAILQLSRQFNEVPLKSVNKKNQSQDLRQGEPFEPTMVYTMLTKVNTTLGIKQGRQEDAEEFLGCLLNGLHDEMVVAIQVANGITQENGPKDSTPNGVAEAGEDEEEEDGEDDEWEQVGPKNKSSVIRKADFSRSPVYDIFGGQMRSALHQQGVKESAMLQPFFTLQLDIQSPKILSVKEALENLGTREAVHGFMSNKTKTEVEASKRTSLEELPPVLILHLKRFVYDKTGGCQKLMKKMEYDMDLEISRDLLSSAARVRIPLAQRCYKLFAVIYHTGKETYGGHYISDFYHVGTNSWVRADDNNMKNMLANQVLKPPIPFTPYLLFYRRRETLPSSQNSLSSGRSAQIQAKA